MSRPGQPATPAGILYGADGRIIPMSPGPCLWCGRYVAQGRDLAGATRPFDPCWHDDGDFGCEDSPETNDEGIGGHARPYDLALFLLRPATYTPGGYDAKA